MEQPKTTVIADENEPVSTALYHNKATRELHSVLTNVANLKLRITHWKQTHQQPPPIVEGKDGGPRWLNRAERRKLGIR